jgi:hypothetical protein
MKATLCQLSVLLTELVHEFAAIMHTCEEALTPKPKWSDIVANMTVTWNKREHSSVQKKADNYSHTYLSSVDVVRIYEHTVGGCISLLKLNRESEFGSQDGKRKIVFIDDSHVRGCARELTQNLDESCKLPVYVLNQS